MPVIMGDSEDGAIKVYRHSDASTLKLGVHRGVSCIKMSSSCAYAASLGSDGIMKIYSIKSGKQVWGQKIVDEPSSKFGFEWLPETETLVIPGKKEIGFLHQADEDNESDWTITYESSVSHAKPIVQLCCIKDDVLLTCCSENLVKVWSFGEEGGSQKWTMQADSDVSQICWNADAKCLAIAAANGKLTTVYGDFERATNFEVQPQQIEEQAEAVEDLNLDEIDMEDFEMAADDTPIPDPVSAKEQSAKPSQKEQPVEEAEQTEIVDKKSEAVAEDKSDEKEQEDEIDAENLQDELMAKASSVVASSQRTKQEKKIKRKNIETTSVDE